MNALMIRQANKIRQESAQLLERAERLLRELREMDTTTAPKAEKTPDYGHRTFLQLR